MIGSTNATGPCPQAPVTHCAKALARQRRCTRLLSLQLPFLVGAVAAVGAIKQIDVSAGTLEPHRLASAAQRQEVVAGDHAVSGPRTDWDLLRNALPADAIGRVDRSIPAFGASGSSSDSSGAGLEQGQPSSGPTPFDTSAATLTDDGEDESEEIVIAAAERLRGDPVQTARVPMPPVSAMPAHVRLDATQRSIARYIAQTYRLSPATVDRLVYLTFKVAGEARLDPYLLLAIIAVESSFNPFAESGVGAQGLMQVHTRVHANKFAAYGGVEAAWDPLANIRVGARILAEYLDRYGDIAGALKAYVGAALREHDGGYGQKVLARVAEFEAIARGDGSAVGSLAGPDRATPPDRSKVSLREATPADSTGG